jgi:hypothetical protein
MQNKNNIVCRWMARNKFLVNPDKQVWPCCYLANQGYKFKVTGKYKDSALLEKGVDNTAQPISRSDYKHQGVNDITHPIMQSYHEQRHELNLENNSIEEVLSHDWFTQTLPESWDSDNPHRLCMLMCSKKLENE